MQLAWFQRNRECHDRVFGRDVIQAIRATLGYLQFMHEEFEGDWLLAAAGYDCGENCVARAVARNKREGKPTTSWSLRLPNETRAYVPTLLTMKRFVADPVALGLEFSPIPRTYPGQSNARACDLLKCVGCHDGGRRP